MSGSSRLIPGLQSIVGHALDKDIIGFGFTCTIHCSGHVSYDIIDGGEWDVSYDIIYIINGGEWDGAHMVMGIGIGIGIGIGLPILILLVTNVITPPHLEI